MFFDTANLFLSPPPRLLTSTAFKAEHTVEPGQAQIQSLTETFTLQKPPQKHSEYV